MQKNLIKQPAGKNTERRIYCVKKITDDTGSLYNNLI